MRYLLFLLLLAVGLLGSRPLAGAADGGDSGRTSVRQLITQLGARQYVLRHRAEIQLLERGAEAFAELQAAESHADLEISTRARYILTQISIDWTRPYDPPVVRSIMARYGESPLKNKLSKVAKLSQLEHEQGFGALCRIARYESSGQIARYAALAILEKGFLPKARTAAAVKALAEEMGETPEAPQSWVAAYMEQLQAPEQIDPGWLPLLDAEIELLAEEKRDTSQSLVATFLSSHLELCDQLSDAEAIVEGLGRRIELGAIHDEAMSGHLIDVILWLTDREQWDALGLLEDRYADSIKQEHMVLYRLALARDKQGREARAEELAEQALHIETTDAEDRNEVADLLSGLGRHDWAEREWKSVIETEEVTDYQSLMARQSLALFRLHDRLEHKAGADLMTASIDAIYADPQIKKEYLDENDLSRPLERFRSNREFLLACHEESQGNLEQQRQHLEQANSLEKGNADILIAMFHLAEKIPGAKDAYRKKVRKRLGDAKSQLEKEMNDAANVPAQRRDNLAFRAALAQRHNHWAWLVSNTEGNFKKAVEYSQRSLELAPGSPSYLDTLGRCYYATGDLENAIKVQREAIAKHPHMMVMQRQLQQFEDELPK